MARPSHRADAFSIPAECRSILRSCSPMSPEYVAKHKPEVGGYYVVYEDGYKSFSPAGAFESGYTPL